MASRASSRALGETDAERMAGTFASKAGLARGDFIKGDKGLAIWRVALVLWCYVGLPCVCAGAECLGCYPLHSNPSSPYEYQISRSCAAAFSVVASSGPPAFSSATHPWPRPA